MPILLCQRWPALRIYDPKNDVYAQFVGGKLVIEPDDPSFGVVMAEAGRNADIRVLEVETTTIENRVETKTVVVKEAAPNSCDVCVPAQVFDTPELLALHVKLVHAESEVEEPVRPRRAKA